LLVLWHLLSLDAPTVAALWTWFLARANHIRLPGTAVFAMFLAVWMLYAADRLLDARLLDSCDPAAGPAQLRELEARHIFHRRHKTAFRAGIAVASLALAAIVPHLAPTALPLYLLLGGMLAVYFVLIHAHPANGPRLTAYRLPKELAVGVFFAAATFIPTVARGPLPCAALLPGALLFAVLCSLNCLFIYAWEHPAAREPETHPATRVALGSLTQIAVAVIAAGVLLAIADARLPRQIPSLIPLACALASALLLMLHAGRARMAPVTLRAAADLCLLTPLLAVPLLLFTLPHA